MPTSPPSTSRDTVPTDQIAKTPSPKVTSNRVAGSRPPTQSLNQDLSGHGAGGRGSQQLPGILGLQQNLRASPLPIAPRGNANFALNAASMADQKASLAMKTCSTLAKVQIRTERWSRDLKINQERAKYKSPSDKKAVGYLIEEKFDLNELL